MTTHGTPPVFAQHFGFNACHHCKHIMGIPSGILRSSPRQHVSRGLAYDSNNCLYRKVAPASQPKVQGQSTLSTGSNDVLHVDQIPYQN